MAYEKQKRYERKKAAEVADIGEIPAIENPARREMCRLDLLKFLETYFPSSTGLKPFSSDHRAAIGRIQSCVLSGGLFGQAFPRGGAKTTISENAVIWAILYGHRLFPVLFGADANAAEGNIDSIKMELSENDLLYGDFPEVCHAVRALEGKPQRCASQTHQGFRTHIAWTADTIVLPTIYNLDDCPVEQLEMAREFQRVIDEEDGTDEQIRDAKIGLRNLLVRHRTPASGAIIATRGIMGGSRGLKYKRADGTQQRPDLVLIDDPQTDESASTPLQVNKRLNVIRKNILKLGGHAKKLAVVMNATVIKPDDLVEQIFDPRKFPAWQCVRIKMVKKWADAHDTLWLGDYARLRNTYDQDVLGDQQRAHRAATEFYVANRARMDAGCEVFWEHCYDPDTEVSAVQHAYNLLIDDGEEVFASECQNEPLVAKIEGEQDAVPADAIAAKVNRLPRYAVPAEANRLVAFIDVHDNVLYYEAAGVGDGFTGGVVDYGTWPEQREAYFAQRGVKNTIAKRTGLKQFEEQLYAALDTLTNALMSREWKREDGTLMKPERILVDARDGDHAETVKLFCRRSAHAAVLLPSNGIYVGAKRQPLNDRPPQTGERRGWNWRIEPKSGTRGILRFDTNAWKSRAVSFWRVPPGGKGCMTIFGDRPDQHRMYAAHQAAEYPVKVTANGRTVTEFQPKPNQDNHLLDCHVGCLVAAGTLGVDVAGEAPKRVRRRLSDLQQGARHHAARTA